MANSQALLQLGLLGYKIGDRIPIFQSPPKGMSPEEMLKQDLAFRTKNEHTGKTEVVPLNKHGVLVLTHDGAKFEKQVQSKNFATVETFADGLAYLDNLSKKGYSTYLYVNGARYNRDVKHCPALFYECDDCSKAEQWQKVEHIKTQGFEPSFVVDSGKSLHVYFVVNGLTVEDFPKYQQRLIQLVNSDPSIHNLARQMRLAGFDHTKFVDGAITRKPINIVLKSDKTYDVEEFNNFLPTWNSERWEKHSKHDIDLEAWEKVKAERKAEFKKTGRSSNLIDFLNFEVLPRFDHNPELLFNWAGHNFKAYGRTLKGQPPNRTSDSGTSFHVWHDGSHWAWQDKLTREGGGAVQYRYKLHGGIGTPKGKDFVEIVEELANDVGLELPTFEYEKTYSTPIADVAKKLNAAPEKAIKDRANVNRFRDLIETAADKLTQKPRGFAAKIAPLVENISQNHDGVMFFKEGDRNKKYAELIKSGHKLILDRSGTGKGKSHDAGLATKTFFIKNGVNVDGTVFLSTDYLNPTTKTLEDNRTVVPPRHGGQIYANDKTPSGKPHLKRWNGEEPCTPQIEANCPEEHPIYGAFTLARSKNLPLEAMQTSIEKDGKLKTVNKICARCPMVWNCDFKESRKTALSSPDLSMHPASMPDGFGANKIAIVDEADKTLEPVVNVSATKGEILESAHWLKQKSPELSAKIEPILSEIATNLDKLEGDNYYGMDRHTLLPLMGELPDRETAITMAEEIVKLMLPDSFEEPDSIVLDGIVEKIAKPDKRDYNKELKRLKAACILPKSLLESEADYQLRLKNECESITKEVMARYHKDLAEYKTALSEAKAKAKAIKKKVNRALSHENRDTMIAMLNAAPNNVIEPILRAIANNGSIYLSRSENHTFLNVVIANQRQQQQMTSFEATIFQSATMTADELRFRLGLPSDYPITEIAQEGTFEIIPNLKIIQVTGIGNTLRRRSDIQNKKLEALKAYAYNKYGEVEIIGYKGQKDTFYFGKHDRGTNQFSGVSAMIIAGFPLQNLGVKLAEYQCLYNLAATKSSDDFLSWYYQQSINQSIQTVGRQRAALYPQKEFVIYLTTDIPLPSLLGGGVVSKVDISELCPEVATQTSENKKKIYQLAKEAISSGIKITQKIVADALGITQQAVSKTYGVFMQFVAESINLGINLEPISSNDKADVSNASEEIREVLDSNKTAIQKLKNIFDWTLYNIDDRLFRHVWACIGAKYQAELLRLIGGIIPNWLTS